MNKNKIRVGLLGVKNHGRTILNAIKESGNLKLISVFDADHTAAQNTAKEFGAAAAMSYDDLLRISEIEAVLLVTPNHLHFEEVKKAATAGKHVFVEKPMALTVAEGVEMIDSMAKASLVLMAGHNTRRRRVFRRAKELLLEERIGKVVSVEMNLSRPAGLQPGLPAWKSDNAKCPLLPMTQLGIHFVDTIEYLLGKIQRVSCFAASRAMPAGAMDTACALFQLSGGILATLSSSYVTPDSYFMNIHGTSGVLRCNALALKIELAEKGEVIEIIDESFENEGAESYILEVREFGDCIRNGKQPETGAMEGLRAVAVIEAMQKSVDKKSAVEISEIIHSHDRL